MDTAVGLVESYLRLNGYFTLPEFSVQRAASGATTRFQTATDLDIVAVRFPWAGEAILTHVPHRSAGATWDPLNPREILLADDAALAVRDDVQDVLIGEVKEGASALNRALRTPEVLYTALRRIGCCPQEHFGEVGSRLAREGEALIRPGRGVMCRVRLVSFCGHVGELPSSRVLTITLDHIVRFIAHRFETYGPLLRSAQFKDPALGLLKLFSKLGLTINGAADGVQETSGSS